MLLAFFLKKRAQTDRSIPNAGLLIKDLLFPVLAGIYNYVALNKENASFHAMTLADMHALAIETASFLVVSSSGFVKNEQICIENKTKKIQ
ncbi:hypothetical protein LPB136_05220 [Tenacibaculum todarodis]|uniref:Uncharacterized protein n=1 Tax=Tenacibaculum todarodis TaxID=1850252 RepID=A0A1L3JI48_9FLAO|nr:hypothetical protein LPB136_05220 [Tenacibaculum todarodis]